MELGKINSLRVAKDTPHGIFLEDEDGKEVLLPGKYLKGDEKTGDLLDVFLYNDSEDRLVATTETPKIMLDQFAALKVKDVNQSGVFLDWGLEKDLLVPFKEQNKKMQLGYTYVVRMYLDEETDRLVATGKVKQFLSNENLSIKEKDRAELMIISQSELGFDVMINEKHFGLVFRNEVFTPLKNGDKLTGFIKKIRPDGKIDVTLQPDIKTHIAGTNEDILEILRANEGILKLSDKSSPEEIYDKLGISKKAFKRSVGSLYKQGKIKINDDKIVLVN